jgi:hypothetical protein
MNVVFVSSDVLRFAVGRYAEYWIASFVRLISIRLILS